jgi:predicted PurR-regulated permease PerM
MQRTTVTSERTYNLQNQLFFFGLFASLAVAVLWLIGNYIGVIAFSLVMVIILKPVHRFFMRHMGDRSGLATLLTLLLFFAVFIVPGWFIVSAAGSQLEALRADLSAGTEAVSIEAIRDRINNYITQIPGMQDFTLTPEQEEKVRQLATGAAQWLSSAVIGLGMSIPLLLAQTFIFLGVVGSLLPNYDKFVQRLLLLSPLSDAVDRLYLRKIKAMVWSMFVGMFVIAIGQGLIMGLLYWIGDVPYLGPLTLLSIVAAMLPLGASLIALPVGIVMLLLGNYVPAIVILAGYLLVVANIDNLVRPRLVSKDAYLSFAAVMVSALGGYALFGFFGVIYGPVLMILFQTTVDVYQEHYLAGKGWSEDSVGSGGVDAIEDEQVPNKVGDSAAAETAEDR